MMPRLRPVQVDYYSEPGRVLRFVPISMIRVKPVWEPRRYEEAYRRIQAEGTLPPVMLSWNTITKQFDISDGIHRTNAARDLGYTEVPAIIPIRDQRYLVRSDSMPVDKTHQAIDQLIKNRGLAAERIWRIFGGFEPSIDPRTALKNLQTHMEVVRYDMQDEAKSLAADLQHVLENPPVPPVPSESDLRSTFRSTNLPGIGKITEVSTRIGRSGRITGIFG